MTNRDTLLKDGFIIFPAVVPLDLCQRAVDSQNLNEGASFLWADAVAEEFKAWGKQFLENQQLDLHGWECPFHAFNRRPGTDPLYWHDDDSRNHPFYKTGNDSPGRRVFACTYFVSTFGGRAPLRVIPNSHHGGYEEFRIRFTTMRLQVSNVAPFAGYTGDQYEDYPDIWGEHADQTVLEVPAGSIIVCDERILHSAPKNATTERRPMALWWLEKSMEDRNREPAFADAYWGSR